MMLILGKIAVVSSFFLSCRNERCNLTFDLLPLQSRADTLQHKSSERECLQRQLDQLATSCEPRSLQQLQAQWQGGVQPYVDAQQQLQLAAESLHRLEAFLQTRGVAAGVLRSLRQTVESAGSWERSRVQELQQDLTSIVPDIGRLETLAVSLDGSLCKAHLHLVEGATAGETGPRITCRALADLLGVELEAVRSMLGAKQSEAEELGALWTAFRQRREQLLKSVEDLEQQAEQQGLKEPSVIALQQRSGL